MSAVDRVLVVVPARDEETLLPACLDALARAVEIGHREVAIVVVADRCRDRTADLARAAGVHVVETDAGCVGAARRAGVEAGLALLPPAPDDRTWLASTDADTRVPPVWLRDQLALAATGIGLVVGPAVPDRRDLDRGTWRAWRRRHAAAALGVHVHGANLGFRLDAYCAAGGWPRLPEHEDRHLVDAMLAAEVPAAAGPPVTTSGRLHGRVGGGFSGYLRGLRDVR